MSPPATRHLERWTRRDGVIVTVEKNVDLSTRRRGIDGSPLYGEPEAQDLSNAVRAPTGLAVGFLRIPRLRTNDVRHAHGDIHEWLRECGRDARERHDWSDDHYSADVSSVLGDPRRHCSTQTQSDDDDRIAQCIGDIDSRVGGGS
jgi:hypothetical protein